MCARKFVYVCCAASCIECTQYTTIRPCMEELHRGTLHDASAHAPPPTHCSFISRRSTVEHVYSGQLPTQCITLTSAELDENCWTPRSVWQLRYWDGPLTWLQLSSDISTVAISCRVWHVSCCSTLEKRRNHLQLTSSRPCITSYDDFFYI